MIEVQYPEPAFRIKTEEGRRYIFDAIRKSWLLLTGEEWVRQNFVNYLIRVLHYPSTMIALEKEIKLGELKKRFDILIYNKDYQPWMLVECKEPSVKLSEQVLHQALRYNISVPVQYVVITNGTGTLAWKKDKELMLIREMPSWDRD